MRGHLQQLRRRMRAPRPALRALPGLRAGLPPLRASLPGTAGRPEIADRPPTDLRTGSGRLVPVSLPEADAARLRRRGFRLEYATIPWMVAAAALPITTQLLAVSITLT